jgi:hypothetical protein
MRLALIMIGPTQIWEIWVAAVRFPSYGGFLVGRAARIVRHGQAWSLWLAAKPGDRGLPGRTRLRRPL